MQIEYDFRTLPPKTSILLNGDYVSSLEIKVTSVLNFSNNSQDTANIESGFATLGIGNKRVNIDYWSPIVLKDLGCIHGKIDFVSAYNPAPYEMGMLSIRVIIGYQKNEK